VPRFKLLIFNAEFELCFVTFRHNYFHLRAGLLPISLIAVILFFFNLAPVQAQYKIKGTVYDSTKSFVVPFVSVLSTSGKGTSTNGFGEYEIAVGEKDSIWFSYLDKPTVKFPVLKISNPMRFDISLQVNVTVLKEVRVRPRNYKQDSVQNRQDYAKVFNYEKPGLGIAPSQYGTAAGFDLNELINVFRFRKNRNMQAFQNRLVAQEQEKFVDHRFSKALVRRLTQLNGNELDSFMMVFRPPYYFTAMTDEYDFQLYIKESLERYRKGLPPIPFLRDDEYE
jgi:hypothetical protein